ncbi:uncharacterized protein V1518DRAFT_417988 [Limtongia smithiae]|uniref:uncharacterized protein n=1 Tax=Limtongia smithiae TaxID=1125753 RepID=UPI0034CF8B9B
MYPSTHDTSPRPRRQSTFDADAIRALPAATVPSTAAQSPAAGAGIRGSTIGSTPTVNSGASSVIIPAAGSGSVLPLSTSASSVASSTLLDHRAYPAPSFPPARRRRRHHDSSASNVSVSPTNTRHNSNTSREDSSEESSGSEGGTEGTLLLPRSASTMPRNWAAAGRRAPGNIAQEHDRYMQGGEGVNTNDAYLIDIGDDAASPQARHTVNGGHLLDIDFDDAASSSSHATPKYDGDRSRTLSSTSLDDVCVPLEAEGFGIEDAAKQRPWPDVLGLQEWADGEQVAAAAAAAAAAATPADGMLLVDGRPRLRNNGPSYYLEDNSAQFRHRRRGGGGSAGGAARSVSRNPAERGYPYRFTYFREDLEKTIHAQTISGLLGHGMSFEELFPASPDVLVGTATPMASEDAPTVAEEKTLPKNLTAATVASSILRPQSAPPGRSPTPRAPSSYMGAVEAPRDRPYPFWLDILNPTDAEMKVISKSFGIHPLTTEDICMEETREKVELFRTYYLVCFRSFEFEPHVRQRRRRREREADSGRRSSFGKRGDLVPVNLYIIVFRDGVLSFHFRPTPHPANVRRRIRQLRDYVSVSADWISYAIIDNVTDAFAPLLGFIEEEVQDIDTEILEMHSGELEEDESGDEQGDDGSGSDIDGDGIGGDLHRLKTRRTNASDTSSIMSGKSGKGYDVKHRGDMLRRIGECRKQVMSIMRLLGYKADVIKGFAKRCNEQWEVAPRSEIGLYLGDIQDHIITMVQNLTHYEKLLARSHSNYLAQINIEMTKVNNETNDVLGRLTILGTIVLPMNIITGLWGMNVFVPGQEAPGLAWFYSITMGLVLFGVGSYVVAKRVYGIA